MSGKGLSRKEQKRTGWKRPVSQGKKEQGK
jgi:hypothetical protein